MDNRAQELQKSYSQLSLLDDPPRLPEHRFLQQPFLQHETSNPHSKLDQIKFTTWFIKLGMQLHDFTSSPKGRLISEDTLEEKEAKSKRNAKAVWPPAMWGKSSLLSWEEYCGQSNYRVIHTNPSWCFGQWHQRIPFRWGRTCWIVAADSDHHFLV